MLPALFLAGALAAGQPPAAEPEKPVPPQAPAVEPPPAAAPDLPPRYAFMREAQGTWLGALLDGNRLSVSGWTDLTATASTNRVDNLPLGFNYRANRALLQQNWLRIERGIDEKATEPTWGFRSDTILPGADYRFTLARGLFDGQLTADDGRPNLYGVDPIQFYAELYLPQAARGLDLKLGRFFAQYGVESNDTTQNALSSHAYNFIYNPFTNTGLLATLKLTDAWSVQSGIVAGSDVFLTPESNATYIGSVKWAPSDGRNSALFAVILGKGRYDADRSFSNPQVFDLVATHKFSDRLMYTAEGLYSYQNGVPDVGFVNNWGAVQYLTCQFAPKLSGTARLEFFGDPQGFKTGSAGTYTAVTTGVTYKPLPGLWFRPELRYDRNDETRPFEGKADLFTATMNVVIRW